jgi:uncharacterized membrane protein
MHCEKDHKQKQSKQGNIKRFATLKPTAYIYVVSILRHNLTSNNMINVFYIIAGIISWIVFYYVVKAAVRNGIKEAHSDKELPKDIAERKDGRFANSDQLKLQQRYEKGEITFEAYQTEWNKLNT